MTEPMTDEEFELSLSRMKRQVMSAEEAQEFGFEIRRLREENDRWQNHVAKATGKGFCPTETYEALQRKYERARELLKKWVRVTGIWNGLISLDGYRSKADGLRRHTRAFLDGEEK